MTSKYQEILNWTNLEKFEKQPISTFKMKTIVAVLTQKGAGHVICPKPKCNALNIVRDGIFRCHCGFKSNIRILFFLYIWYGTVGSLLPL